MASGWIYYYFVLPIWTRVISQPTMKRRDIPAKATEARRG